ncbi:hypothetical protein HBB16_03010 [Pseudonocardia sp. MCCB 268]|nr:hypothetical protein [Pseudonocardia cytotoxica]
MRRQVAELVRAAPAGPAGNKLVTVDGFSGARKSTRARELAQELAAHCWRSRTCAPAGTDLHRVPGLARRGISDAARRDDCYAGRRGTGARPARASPRAAAGSVVVLEGAEPARRSAGPGRPGDLGGRRPGRPGGAAAGQAGWPALRAVPADGSAGPRRRSPRHRAPRGARRRRARSS